VGDHADDAMLDAFDKFFELDDLRSEIEDLYKEDGDSFYPVKIKSEGPGECPKCGAPTTIRSGKFGEFYGCIRYPKCKGVRNIV
jgi:ssDNA-binding Zn-finger/Zn-ribbon topoisomerase 1